MWAGWCDGGKERKRKKKEGGMVGWSVKALKRRTQVTTGKAKASFFPNRRGNQVRSREKIPVFGEQDD